MNNHDKPPMPSDDEFENGLKNLFKQVEDGYGADQDNVELQRYVDAQRHAFKVIKDYLIDKGMVSSEIERAVLSGRVYSSSNALSTEDENKIWGFVNLCDTYTFLAYSHESDDMIPTYDSEIMLVQELVGDIAQLTFDDMERKRWMDSITEIILPKTKHLTANDIEEIVEQSESLIVLSELRDLESKWENSNRRAVKDTVRRLLEAAYGIHDDIDDVTRAVVYAAEFRALDNPFDFREKQLQQYLDRYPLAEEFTAVATRLFRTRKM